ncbi:MAG: TMEM43 family protein [Brevundimonas sp.]|uniref:TMEM43 family protein n=1 Tax=Brevundimonas sp. TaxID=1871086 RepID=UPI002ABB9AE2|nr:TMEM43 family protein [Brevundimonas sp.]MDZ4111548.1 TMEM43 family protein [Brevundimonas sp.]
MSPDRITQTTQRSWFQRLGSALTGVLVGLVMAAVGVVVLSWNEGRSIAQMRGLSEGARMVVSAPLATIDPANEGRLIHLSGLLRVEGRRTDPLSGVSAEGVSLKRSIELYQWSETRRSETRTKLGGGEETVTTYTYARGWSSTAEDSTRFHTPQGHENPAPLLDDTLVSAEEGQVGAYRVDRRLLNAFQPSIPVLVTQEDARALSMALSRPVRVETDALYVGMDPARPAVGDIRIRYTAAPAGSVSVVAAQSGGALAPFTARSGAEIFLVTPGMATAQEMLQQAREGNQVLTWVLRLGGVVGLIVGFGLILAPLPTLADVLPPLGAVARFGTGTLAAIGGVAVGVVVIAVAWFAVRPVFSLLSLAGIGLIVAAVLWVRRPARTVSGSS